MSTDLWHLEQDHFVLDEFVYAYLGGSLSICLKYDITASSRLQVTASIREIVSPKIHIKLQPLCAKKTHRKLQLGVSLCALDL